MADEKQVVRFDGGQGSAAPAQPAAGAVTPPAQPEASQTAPRYVTFEEAQQLAREAAEQAARLAQSRTDKAAQKMQERVNELRQAFDTLKAAGHEVPAEQQQQALAKVAEEYPTPNPKTTPSTAQEEGRAGDPLSAAIDRKVAALAAAAGVDILEDDPEAQGLDFGDPFEFVRSFERALAAKKARTQAPAAAPVGNPNRAPVSGGGAATNPLNDMRDPRDLLARGLRGG